MRTNAFLLGIFTSVALFTHPAPAQPPTLDAMNDADRASVEDYLHTKYGLAAPTPSVDLSFRDNFNVSARSTDVDFENTLGRQSGSAGVLSYLETTAGASDALSQVNAPDAPGQLRLEVTGTQIYTAVCPNHNFTEGGRFSIDFDLDAGLNDPSGTSGDWACIVFGATSPLAFVNSSDGMGILFRNNGAIQVFDGAGDTGGGGLLSLGPIHVRIEVDAADFQGRPATVRMFANGTQVQLGSASLEYTKAGGFHGNYITLGCYAAIGSAWVNAFDNFMVSAIPCIRPSVAALKSYAGQTNQVVTVSIPPTLNADSAVDVVVTSANPAIAEPLGADAGSLTLTFAAGGPTSQSFVVSALSKGSTTLNLSTSGDACIGGSVTVTVGGTFLNNPSFEDNSNGGVGYGPILGWSGPSGVNNATQPFADNGTIPDRAQVAFIQGSGVLSQTISGLMPGESHWLQFHYNVRNCCGGTMNLAVRFAGQVLTNIPNVLPGLTNGYHFRNVVFIPSTDSGLLEFATSAAGDASLVLDAVSIVRRGTNRVQVVNPSFEASGVAPFPGYINPLPMAGWTGTGNYGVNRSGVGPFADNGINADQDSVAFIQGVGSLSQVISNLVVGQEYQISYTYNARLGSFPWLQVSIGGDLLQDEEVLPLESPMDYYRTTIPWIATASSAALQFTQVQSFGDNTILLDDVQVTGLALPPCETTLSTQNAEFFNSLPTITDVVTVTLPLYLVATQAVDILVISSDPTVAIPAGAVGDTLVLHLPAGLTNSVSFTITALRSGTVSFLVTNSVECPGATFTVRNRSSFVLNPSFEDNSATVWPGYNPIASWSGPSGLNPVVGGESPFADNGAIPDRNQVAFMQLNVAETKALTQVVYGLDTNQQYWLQVAVNARNCCGDPPNAAARFNGVELASVPAVPPVGGSSPYHFVNLAFTPNSPTGELAFVSGPTATGNDRTLLLDAVSLVPRDAGNVVIWNPSFEASGTVPGPGYLQPAPLAGWTGQGAYGVNVCGAGPFADNGVAPDQDNVAFLQGQGSSISQTISGLMVGARYMLSYAYNARGGNTPQLIVTVGGAVQHDEIVTSVGGNNLYRTTNITFQAASESVAITFAQSATDDHAVLLDDVKLALTAPVEVRLTIQRSPPDTVRISWPASAGLEWILLSTGALPGEWSDPGLPVWPEGDEYAVYDTAGSGNNFYQLVK